MTEPDEFDTDSEVDPRRKKQDGIILEAFSLADHHVVTTKEISESVDLSDRQVRRRLNELDGRDIIDSRMAGGSKIWWLEEEIRKPVTAQYPLLRYVRDRVSVQMLLIGILIGIIGMMLSATAVFSEAYGVPLPLVESSRVLRVSLLGSFTAVLFVLVGLGMTIVRKVLPS